MALADQCVLCGLCLPHCPTYGVDRIEAESPRGRIMQFRALAIGQLTVTAAAKTHLDHCLGCRNCEPVCPAGVRYGDILDRGRAMLRARRAPQWRQRLLEWTVARRHAVRLAAWIARRVRIVLPGRLRALAQELAPAGGHWPQRVASPTPARGTVALLPGCVGAQVQPAAVDAAIQVLNALGWDVHVARDPGCCGALARHGGNPAEADRLAREHASRLQDAGIDTVLLVDSGCVGALATGLGTAAPALRVVELMGFVAADARAEDVLATAPPDHGRPPVALHLPCTQRNVSGAARASTALLSRTCGAAPALVGGSGCCGAAGQQLLFDPARAALFRAPVLDAVRASGAATLATANVGCRMHLSAGLAAEAGRPPPRVVHPIELLAAHLRKPR